MAILGKSSAVSLGAALAHKGQELRRKESSDAEAAQALAVQSQEAARSSAVAAEHASAVERALKILDDAGVEI